MDFITKKLQKQKEEYYKRLEAEIEALGDNKNIYCPDYLKCLNHYASYEQADWTCRGCNKENTKVAVIDNLTQYEMIGYWGLLTAIFGERAIEAYNKQRNDDNGFIHEF